MMILLKNSSYFNEMQITLDNERVERLGIYRYNEYTIEQIKIFTYKMFRLFKSITN